HQVRAGGRTSNRDSARGDRAARHGAEGEPGDAGGAVRAAHGGEGVRPARELPAPLLGACVPTRHAHEDESADRHPYAGEEPEKSQVVRWRARRPRAETVLVATATAVGDEDRQSVDEGDDPTDSEQQPD